MTRRRRKPSRFGARLIHFRRRAYLSRQELARRSGTSVDSIHSWEEGRAANPTLRTVFRLARALEVTVRTLLEGLEEEFDIIDEPSVPPEADDGPSR